jgi:phosphoribosylformylglycinamidine cyclo-ligase
MSDGLSYADSGVDLNETDAVKRRMKASIDRGDPRLLNTMGAFGSLVDARFAGYDHPVLVLKMEEPGSKQKLAIQHRRAASLGSDLINHLINDVIVMGAEPLYAQDCIICGELEAETVRTLVDSMAAACRAQGCVLTGGETSVQAGVIGAGEYVLSAALVGVVEKRLIIDGSRIKAGDAVLAIASNGLHTNGYTLIRRLMQMDPRLESRDIGGETFLNVIMRPHKCYYLAVKDLFAHPGLKGLAHITGGGVQDNLNRILPDSLDALVDLSRLRPQEVFKVIRRAGKVADSGMLRTFNMGVGMAAVAAPHAQEEVISHLQGKGCDCFEIGRIVEGSKQVRYEGVLEWQ